MSEGLLTIVGVFLGGMIGLVGTMIKSRWDYGREDRLSTKSTLMNLYGPIVVHLNRAQSEFEEHSGAKFIPTLGVNSLSEILDSTWANLVFLNIFCSQNSKKDIKRATDLVKQAETKVEEAKGEPMEVKEGHTRTMHPCGDAFHDIETALKIVMDCAQRDLSA